MANPLKKFKITFNAPVTLIFVALCFVATLLGVISKGLLTSLLFSTYRSSLTNPLTYLRMFTHIIGHGDFNHFISNASYLLLLGPLLEEKYGAKTLVTVMLVTAIVTALANALFFPNVALCGASGVVFAFIMLSSITGIKEGEIPMTFILVAVIYIGQQVVQGLTVNDNISNSGHIIGGLVGSVLGFVFNRTGKKMA